MLIDCNTLSPEPRSVTIMFGGCSRVGESMYMKGRRAMVAIPTTVELAKNARVVVIVDFNWN